MDENEVRTIQIDGPNRQVFIKFAQAHVLSALLDRTKSTAIYNYGKHGISRVSLCPAGWGRRIVRVAKLPPKMPADVNQRAMHKFDNVQKNNR
jgi:hypothetical protein